MEEVETRRGGHESRSRSLLAAPAATAAPIRSAPTLLPYRCGAHARPLVRVGEQRISRRPGERWLAPVDCELLLAIRTLESEHSEVRPA